MFANVTLRALHEETVFMDKIDEFVGLDFEKTYLLLSDLLTGGRFVLSHYEVVDCDNELDI